MRRLFLMFCTASVAFCQTAAYAEWFETEGTSCSGLPSVRDAFLAYAPDTISALQGSGAGNYYVSIPAAQFTQMRTSGEDQIAGVVQLSLTQARDLSRAVRQAGESAQVPQFVNIGTSILTGLALPVKIGTGSGLLFTYFFNNINVFSSNLITASAFIADGGEVYHRSSVHVRAQDSARFLSYSTEYRVNLGRERRIFIHYACIYPIRVAVSEFHTAGPSNNKIVRNIEGRNWRVWDVDNQRYEGDAWKYLRQDGGFFYFEVDAIENNNIVGQTSYRLSFTGGPWQRRRHDAPANDYQSYYAAMSIR